MQTPLTLSWYACDLKTGRIIEDLPALTPSGTLPRRLGQTTTATFALALAGAPAEWEAATAPGRTLLVAVDDATNLPIWPGIILTRSDRGSGTTLTLGAASPESYLDGRYSGTYTAYQQDKATIVSNLLTPALTDGPPFVLDAPAIGSLMDYSVDDGDDRTILSVLQEVMAAEGGPEWTIDVAWNADGDGFVLPIRVRAAVGTQSTTPEATFDFPGNVTSYSQAESYEQGKGATVVQARGDGEGSARLSSAVHEATTLLANGWPRWVYRYTPATGLTDPVALDAHAAASLATMQAGASVWSLTAVASRSPRVGRDFGLGDSIRLAVEESPGHPAGADVTARCWAWELDPVGDAITPILVEDD